MTVESSQTPIISQNIVPQIPAFYFDSTKLMQLAEQHRESFLSAQPFPHVVMDHFLPEDILQILIQEFPGPDDIEWKIWGPGAANNTQDKKREKI